MKRIWKKPVLTKVPITKLTLSGSDPGTEVHSGQGARRRNQ